MSLDVDSPKYYWREMPLFGNIRCYGKEKKIEDK